MDWSKAKTILIFVLIVANIILGTIIYRNDKIANEPDESIKFVEEYLAEKDIHVNTEIPRANGVLNSLYVRFEVMLPRDINSRFFDDDGFVDVSRGRIEYGDESINIINDRRLLYERYSDNYDVVEVEEAKTIAVNFLRDRAFRTDDMILTSHKETEDGIELIYSKIHDGVMVEKSFTNVLVNGDGVVRLDRLWIEVTKDSNIPIDIGSASKALFSLIDDDNYSGKSIDKIEICYYFDPEEQDYVEDITKTIRGRAIPAWRIVFDDGESAIIDNY